MDIEPEKFPEKIKKGWKKLNLSQENLTHALGVSFATFNRWETGKMAPSKLASDHFE